MTVARPSRVERFFVRTRILRLTTAMSLALVAVVAISAAAPADTAEAQTAPYILARKGSDFSDFGGGGWPANSSGTVTVTSNSGSVIATQNVQADASGIFIWEGNLPQQYSAGMTVTASLGGQTRSLVIPNVTVSVDANTDIVTATGPSLDLLFLRCSLTNCALDQIIALNAAGNGAIDVTPQYDITAGEVLRITWIDPDGDSYVILHTVEQGAAPSFSSVTSIPARGIGIVVFDGGTLDQLAAAASAAGARAIYTTANGNWVGYTLGAPAFTNAGFASRFPGAIPAGTPFLLVMP